MHNPARVMVVDDHDDSRELHEMVLRDAGFDVVTARDGEEALELAATSRPAVAVIDVVMPKMNGWELAAALRKSEETRGIRIAVVTGSALKSLVISDDVSVDAYLVKPMAPPDLVSMVERLLA